MRSSKAIGLFPSINPEIELARRFVHRKLAAVSNRTCSPNGVLDKSDTTHALNERCRTRTTKHHDPWTIRINSLASSLRVRRDYLSACRLHDKSSALLNFNMGGISSSTLGTGHNRKRKALLTDGIAGSDRLQEPQQKRKLSQCKPTIRYYNPNQEAHRKPELSLRSHQSPVNSRDGIA